MASQKKSIFETFIYFDETPNQNTSDNRGLKTEIKLSSHSTVYAQEGVKFWYEWIKCRNVPTFGPNRGQAILKSQGPI